jgi:hypothetical protein
MARKSGKMALYEVLSKAKVKPVTSKDLEPLTGSGESFDSLPVDANKSGVDDQKVDWSAKPRIIRMNRGRVEMSLGIELAVGILLFFAVVLAAVFRLGQFSAGRSENSAVVKKSEIAAVEKKAAVSVVLKPVARKPAAVEADTGNNRIVIQSFKKRADLEPAKKFFTGRGIETTILFQGGVYYLVTERKYSNPAKVGTLGNDLLNKIVKVGANYKAPDGYESFGQRPFHDAYGKKFD